MKNSIFIVIFTVVYCSLFVYLNNRDLVDTTIVSDFSFQTKTGLLSSLFLGIITAIPLFNLLILVSTAILTALNIILLKERLYLMKSMGKLHIVTGGGAVLGIVSSGCASCGLPFLAFLGLGGSLGALPLKGYEISLLAMLVVFISTTVLLYQRQKNNSCLVTENKAL